MTPLTIPTKENPATPFGARGNNQNSHFHYNRCSARTERRDVLPDPRHPKIEFAVSDGPVTNTVLDSLTRDWDAFADMFTDPPDIGPKDGHYFVRGPCETHAERSDKNITKAYLAILDGDSGINPETGEIVEGGAPSPWIVHEALVDAKVTHLIYTTHSHGVKGHRYRVLVRVELSNGEELRAVVDWLIAILQERGVWLASVKENYCWSQPWFFPRRRAADAEFLCLRYDDGEPLDVAEILAQHRRNLPSPNVEFLPERDQPDDSPIDRFNRAEGTPERIIQRLTRHDYQLKCVGTFNDAPAFRLLRPGSESGSPGVHVFRHTANGKWVVCSHHGGDDPLAGKQGKAIPHDAFDVFRILEHGGDEQAALAALKKDPASDVVRGHHVPRGGNERQWPEPQPLPKGLPPVDQFDFALLPSSLRPWAEDICERVQCAPDYVAVTILVALAAVIGRKLGVRPQVKTDWTVAVNLWAALVGRPGVLKSPAMEAALAPLKRLVALSLEAYKADTSAYKGQALLAKIKAEESEKAARNVVRDKKKHDDAEILGLLEIEEPEPPILRRYMANDTSAASLGELHRQNPNGLLVYRDEIVSLLKALDREDNSEARGFYLTGWNGDSPYTFDRIGRGLNLHIPAVCISLLGSTQPGRIADYIRHAVRGGAGDDGLIQRFGLLVWPDNTQPWQDVDRWPDSAAKRAASEVFDRLDRLDPLVIGAHQDVGSNGEPEGQPYLRFGPEAQELFREWRSGLESRLRNDELHPAIESHLAKYRKLVPGLALLLHLADGGTKSVSKVATLQALGWAQYLETHANRAYASVVMSEADGAAALLRHIRKGDLPRTFSCRDVWRKGWAHLATRDDATDAISLLVEFGWLVETKRPTDGRPATDYEVNPRGVPE